MIFLKFLFFGENPKQCGKQWKEAEAPSQHPHSTTQHPSSFQSQVPGLPLIPRKPLTMVKPSQRKLSQSSSRVGTSFVGKWIRNFVFVILLLAVFHQMSVPRMMTATETTSNSSTASTTPSTPSPTSTNNPIEIIVGGDLLLSQTKRERIAMNQQFSSCETLVANDNANDSSSNAKHAWGDRLWEQLDRADAVFANLEAPISDDPNAKALVHLLAS